MAQRIGALRLAQRLEDARHAHLRHKGVALHLAQRDGRSGQAPVAKAHGVARILPALVVQAGRGLLDVLEIPVAVAVAVALHPLQRTQRVRMQLAGQREVAGHVVVAREQDEEEGRCVDGAVVGKDGGAALRAGE